MDFKRVKLVGKNLPDILPYLTARKFPLLAEDDHETVPDLVISHGGDGSLLSSEHDWPGIAKLPLRDARTAPQCADHDYAAVLDRFVLGNLPLFTLPKLVCEYNGQRLIAMNDIFLHNFDRISALRYSVTIDGELYATEVAGDGVGVSTVHGSTAYFRSITRSIFRVGIGLAFNNSTEDVNHVVLSEKSVIAICVMRGRGLIIADNYPGTFEIPEGGTVTLRQAEEQAHIYGLNSFMCPKCRVLRHPNKHPFKNFLPHLVSREPHGA